MSNGSWMCANLLSIRNIFPSISHVDYWVIVEKGFESLIKFTFIHPHAHHIFQPPIAVNHQQFKGEMLWNTLKWI